ncbi:MAG: hypothetical protein HFI30_09780 [Lachnospiraceae bacterium]|jgi:hypothetical protein|nr:hypothetical protein [Lachnospiraceae bacterium]
MANILQVTTPNLNTDNRNMPNPADPRYSGDNGVRNPVDPTRVVRADGRDGEQTGNTAQEDVQYSVINYESNYGAFIKGLGENGDLAGALERLLFTDLSALKEAGNTEIGALVDQFLLTMKMDSPEELLGFLQGQQQLQVRFSGDFFNKLRSLLMQNPSDGLKDSAMAFLKGYNNYASGSHLLQQMHTLTEDLEHLLLRSFREEFRELVQGMNWGAANGDTAANTGVLNGRLIPFLSAYISRMHDYGAVRDATMLLIFHAVRYENGGEDRLIQLFERMLEDREFARMFSGEEEAALKQLLESGSEAAAGQRAEMADFADSMAKLLLRGANGQAGLENVQQFYTIMNGMLMNESVYMPLLHFLIPFQLDGNNVVSEMWVDPDARRRSEEEGRKIKLFLKFDIQSLGKFELVMTLQDRESQIQLFVPTHLVKEGKQIQTDVSDILKKNGIRSGQLSIFGRVRDRKVTEVFPEIREKETTINVRI